MAKIFFYGLLLGPLLFHGCNPLVERNHAIANTNTSAKGKAIDFTDAAQRVTPAVVHINTYGTTERNPFEELLREHSGQEQPEQEESLQQRGSGSGVIITTDGIIITSYHTIINSEKIEVVLNDKRSYLATIVGIDPSTDLAVIKIEESNLPTVAFGNSDELQVGEWVLAVGNPFNLTSTVTAGIVSAKGRHLNILETDDNMTIESFIQTDAAANPGNSGGALVNAEGSLVGINAAIASPTGAFAGYSFAVPSNLVRKISNDIIEFGEVQRGLLGASIIDLSAELAREREIENLKGVYIHEVLPQSAAAEAGLETGDIIIAVQGNDVNSSSEVQEIIALKRPGDEVSITFRRNGKNMQTEAILKSQEENGQVRQ
jgi:serine protease Do